MRIYSLNQTRCGFILGFIFGLVFVIMFKLRMKYIESFVNPDNFEPLIFNSMDSIHKTNSDVVARELAEKIKVLCWVMTQPKNLRTKARAVKETWGKRCNILLFFSSEANQDFPVIGLSVPEGRDNLWLKTKEAWRYIFQHHLNDVDWFLKVDDDTFIIVENLRKFLSAYNSSNPHYFGRHFVKQGSYNSGGAGYVFSKETLRRFVRILNNPARCKVKSLAEDKEVGACLHEVNVYPGDTRDRYARETFHPFSPEFHLIPGAIGKDNWLQEFSRWEVKSGGECCSRYTISFHYIPVKRMYLFEYFLYHLHAYDV